MMIRANNQNINHNSSYKKHSSRRYFNMSDNKWEFQPNESDLQNLREWLKKMPHIVQDYDDEFLAAFVRGCKGSLQKTKNILENFNSLGYRYPYMFGDLDPLHPRLQEHLSASDIFPLPKRLEDGTMVAISAIDSDTYDASKYHRLESYRYFLQFIYIYLWANDFGPGKFVLIMDNRNSSIAHFRDFTPNVMRDIIQVLQTSLPLRPKALHLINVAPSVATIFNLLKSLLPNKFKERMHFHSSIETLYETIPKEILPKEYGGSEENISALSNQWKSKVESYRNRLIEENLKMRRLDSIRPRPSDTENTSETFSRLNID